MRVAIYARASTDKQQTSTQDQIDRCRKYCESKGYRVGDTFSDDAISGAHLITRPAIGQLIEAALQQQYDIILAEDLSRLSRDQGDIASFFKRMSFLGVQVETISEGDINELHIGLKGTMNAMFLKDLADKTRRGVVAAVLKGGVPGGRVYGLDAVHELDSKGELIRGVRRINKEQAAVVKEIFERFGAGSTVKAEVERLNRLGVPSPGGRVWHSSTLVGTGVRGTGILRNTLYKGIVTFNRLTYKKHPDTGKRLSIPNSPDKWIQVPVPELAIISEELFDKCQNRLANFKTSRKNKRHAAQVRSKEEAAAIHVKAQQRWRAKQYVAKAPRQIYSGRLFCVHDEKKMEGLTRDTYGCRKRNCPNKALQRSEIVAVILKEALKVKLDTLVREFDFADTSSDRNEYSDKIACLLESRSEAREKVGNILDALGMSVVKMFGPVERLI